MKRSLFSRYFSLCASIILSSITILGIVLVVLCANYFKVDRMNMLQRKAEQAAQMVSVNYRQNLQKYVDSNIITASFNILSTAVEADFFLTDARGRTMLCVDAGSCNHRTYVVPEAVMAQTLQGSYRTVGRMEDIYKENCYIIGVPVMAGDTVIGAIFAASTAASMTLFVNEILQIFLIGAAIIIFIAFVFIYFSVNRLVNPLQAMARAADSFARGDFSVRVRVEGDEEIEQLARAFNDMASSLAAHEASGRSFVANVSHELRTPMTSIGGFIDGMLDGTIEPHQYNYYLGLVSKEVKRLSRMIVSMLNISRIEAGELKLNPQTVDVNEIMTRTILGFEQQIEDKHVDIEGLDADKMYIDADPDMVHQVLYNLIENAVKFTPAHGKISVSYRTDGKQVITAVTNTGEGIPKEEISMLFDRFYKSDRSRSANTKGVGLGLNIVKSLVNLHGGGITVKSAEGEYTVFEFSMPAAKTPTPIFRKKDQSC